MKFPSRPRVSCIALHGLVFSALLAGSGYAGASEYGYEQKASAPAVDANTLLLTAIHATQIQGWLQETENKAR